MGLACDSHPQQSAASSKLLDWSSVDASLWMLYVTSAKLSVGRAGGLPFQRSEAGREQHPMKGLGLNRRCAVTPCGRVFLICKNWNFRSCRNITHRFRHICLECRSSGHTIRECAEHQSSPSTETPTGKPGHPFHYDGSGKGLQN